jgi:hypothetical protein
LQLWRLVWFPANQVLMHLRVWVLNYSTRLILLTLPNAINIPTPYIIWPNRDKHIFNNKFGPFLEANQNTNMMNKRRKVRDVVYLRYKGRRSTTTWWVRFNRRRLCAMSRTFLVEFITCYQF